MIALLKDWLRVVSPAIVSYDVEVYEFVSSKAFLGVVWIIVHTGVRVVHTRFHNRDMGGVS